MDDILLKEVPLYRIRCYGDFIFRVTKRLFNPSSSPRVVDPEPEQDEDRPSVKFDSALSRAKNMVRELALCNRWEYFVTLTFDDRWDRYSLKDRLKEFLQWIQNCNKSGASIRYLLVPEFHQDGAVHFHALMSGIEPSPRPFNWPESVNRKEDGSYYDIWKDYSDRYGYSAVEPVNDPVAVGFYVSKYITKSLAESSEFVGVHTYYRSRGLQRALEVGSLYHECWALDKACKFSNSFYKFGFCKFDDVGSIVDLCDEVGPMYQNYIITDPVSGEVVSVIGGEEEDIYVQDVLEAFKESGFCCSAWDRSD